jgi:RNA polymerase-binding protein DksA
MLSPQRLQHLREELVAERGRLEGDLAGMNTDELSTDETIGIGNHMADDATEVYNQEAQVSLRRNQQHILSEVKRALQRMERGMYGTCERCGVEIDYARLKATPYALYCMNCQRLVEAES